MLLSICCWVLASCKQHTVRLASELNSLAWNKQIASHQNMYMEYINNHAKAMTELEFCVASSKVSCRTPCAVAILVYPCFKRTSISRCHRIRLTVS